MVMPPMALMKVMTKPGDRVAAHEFGRTVHRTEKIAFVFKSFAAFAGFVFVDQAGGQIGVDRHLLAGHGVQSETRRDFGDTARTFGDDDEIDDGQDGENDDADDEIAAHHQAGEGLNDMARRIRAFIAVGQHQPCRAEIERQAGSGWRAAKR